ncbi:MAG: beta-lactamase family protein [Armatimonadetes bacterium]|nr:beta-lactamase family protein [Armatimonadota bacterium]
MKKATKEDWGGQVLLSKDGKLLLRKSYGKRDESGAKIDNDTRFSLASLAKPVTAAAILRLVTLGKLSLDDTVGKFFPETPEDKKSLTIRQLLSHSSGLPEYHTQGDYVKISRQEALKLIFTPPLRFTPGTQTAYSNSGFTVLAAILEQVTGKSYESAMAELVFKPLGMTHTFFYGQNPTLKNVAVGYGVLNTADNRPSHFPYTWALRGAGGIITTATDFGLFCDAINGPYLSKSVRDEMNSPIKISGGGPPVSEGLGWLVGKSRRGTRVANHGGGSMNGFHTSVVRYIDEGVVLIVLSNRDGGPDLLDLSREATKVWLKKS